jgi:hypothetical protein
MKAYIVKRTKREGERERGQEKLNVVNTTAVQGVDESVSGKEEKTTKANARQTWKKENKTRRRTTFIKSLS